MGDIKASSSENIPYGWLLCDGREVSRTKYSALFNVIGTKFGNGNTINTFNVPDLRECVLVGAGQNEKLNIKEHDVYNVGEFKDDQMQGHKHIVRVHASSGSGNTDYIGAGSKPIDNYTDSPVSDGMNGTPRVGSTTHGKQLGVNYIIKY